MENHSNRLFLGLWLRVLLILVMIFGVIPVMPVQTLHAQAYLQQPIVYQVSATVIGWTAGTINNGGHPVAVVAGTASVTTSETSCAAPAFTGCNLVYANSAGTVSVTTSSITANLNGNSLMAAVETTSSAISQIVIPTQMSTTYLVRAAENCGTTTTCAATPAGSGLVEVFGSVALGSGSPSTASVGNLPFTSSTSYICVASPAGTTAAIAAGGVAISQTAGTSVTFTGPNTVTTVINYRCSGT